jgi:hypothetical protein
MIISLIVIIIAIALSVFFKLSPYNYILLISGIFGILKSITWLQHNIYVEREGLNSYRVLALIRNDGIIAAKSVEGRVSAYPIEEPKNRSLQWDSLLGTQIEIKPGHSEKLQILRYPYDRSCTLSSIEIPTRPSSTHLFIHDLVKYRLDITVSWSNGIVIPLRFSLFIIKDKLDALAKSFKIKDISNVDVVMDVLKEFEKDGDKSLIDRYWRIRNRILEVKSLDEYMNVAKELESLWKSVENKLGSRASYFGIATGILNSYLVYLAAIGKQGEAKDLFTKNEEALNLEREGLEIEGNVLTKLMLSLFRVDGVEVKVDKLIDSFEKHIGVFVPALKLIFGIYSDENVALDECNSKYGRHLYCVDAVKALSGDVNALDSLKNSIFQYLTDGELKQFLAGLDAKNFVLAYSPETPCARLALILHMLGQGDAKSVGALAYVGWRRHTQLPGLENLFREVYDACGSNCSIDNERLMLALLKLYHRLVWAMGLV